MVTLGVGRRRCFQDDGCSAVYLVKVQYALQYSIPHSIHEELDSIAVRSNTILWVRTWSKSNTQTSRLRPFACADSGTQAYL
eukprot:IDg4307t1